MTIVSQKVKKVHFIPFAFSDDFNRQFNCNEIYFEAIGGGTVKLNDVYTLFPYQKGITLKCDQNEIDTTFYKAKIGPGMGTVTLQGWYKVNEGVEAEREALLVYLNSLPVPNRRTQNKAYYAKKRPKSDF
jgi:hypothetical protein